MEQNKNKSNNAKGKILIHRKQEDLELIQKLLVPTLFPAPGTDEHLDQLLFKEKLIGKKELETSDYVSDASDYRSHFYIDFYYGIAKLYGLDKSVMDVYNKPTCAKHFTLQYIYARFPQKVLNALFSKRKSDGKSGWGNKLHQYVSPNAIQMLDLFIDQCVKTMQNCDTITEFKIKYLQDYKVYFQIDMFTDKQIIS